MSVDGATRKKTKTCTNLYKESCDGVNPDRAKARLLLDWVVMERTDAGNYDGVVDGRQGTKKITHSGPLRFASRPLIIA